MSVLVVEDRAEWARVYVAAMPQPAVVCRSLEEADDALRTGSPEALLLDVSLPDGNSLEWLAARPALRSLPLLVVTAHADAEVSQRVMELNGTLLLKPMDKLAITLWASRLLQPARQRLVHAARSMSEEHGLTPRETEVVVECAEGLQHAEIGRALGLSKSRMKRLSQGICEKLDAASLEDVFRKVAVHALSVR